MSDWQRIVDNCKKTGLEEPSNMFDVSESIDGLDAKIRQLVIENKKLTEKLESYSKHTQIPLVPPLGIVVIW